MRKLSDNMILVLAHLAGRISREERGALTNYHGTECALVGRGLLERVGEDQDAVVTDAGRAALDAAGYPAPTEPMHAREDGATVARLCSDTADQPAPYLNDFEDEQPLAEIPRCAFCGYPYDECVCEYPPASVTLKRKVADRRAASGATHAQRLEIMELAAGRNVPAALEPIVTAATSTEAPLAYEDAQDAISRLLRAPRTFDLTRMVDTYRRQNGQVRPLLTPKQARRLGKRLNVLRGH